MIYEVRLNGEAEFYGVIRSKKCTSKKQAIKYANKLHRKILDFAKEERYSEFDIRVVKMISEYVQVTILLKKFDADGILYESNIWEEE